MKHKKQIRAFCLLMLCAMLTGVLQPAMADVKATRILKEMEILTQIPATNLLIAQESQNHKWGVYDTDANVVIPLENEKLQFLAYGCLSAASLPEQTYNEHKKIPLEEINCHALMTLDGTLLTEYAYGVLKVYSPQWMVGWVLEEGTKADNDYTPDKEHYFKIEHCDVLYRGADSAEMEENTLTVIASLTRDEFKDAKAHGDYLTVQSRDSAFTVYDKNAQTIDIGAKNLNSSPYGIKNWMLVNLATGEMVMDGCSQVSEAQTEDGLLLIATRIDFQGRKNTTLITPKGETVIPMCNGVISSVSRDYAIITSNDNGKKGLYSCRDKRMLLACDFDDILENKTAIDRFIGHGYAVVKKDDQFFCYDVEKQQLLPVPELETESTIQHYGPAFYTTNSAGKTTTTQLIAPDGKVKSILASITKSRGSGYLLVAEFASESAAINWYGNNYLPSYYSRVIITDDDNIILNTNKGGYELWKIPE